MIVASVNNYHRKKSSSQQNTTHLMLSVVGQVLIQIGQRVGVPGQGVVHRPQRVTHRVFSVDIGQV